MTKKEKHIIAKRYLQRGRIAERKIKSLYEILSEYTNKATSTTATWSPVKVQSSHSNHKMENAIIDMVDTQEKIENKITELQMMKWQLLNEIQQVREPFFEQMLYQVFIRQEEPEKAKTKIGLVKYKGQCNKKTLLRDSIDAFAECHPEIFEQYEQEGKIKA